MARESPFASRLESRACERANGPSSCVGSTGPAPLQGLVPTPSRNTQRTGLDYLWRLSGRTRNWACHPSTSRTGSLCSGVRPLLCPCRVQVECSVLSVFCVAHMHASAEKVW